MTIDPDGRRQEEQSCSELPDGRGLVMANSPGNNLRTVIIFTANWAARHAAQDGNLPGMSKGVCNRTLKKFFHGSSKGCA